MAQGEGEDVRLTGHDNERLALLELASLLLPPATPPPPRPGRVLQRLPLNLIS